MMSMTPDVELALRAIRIASIRARTIRTDLADDYLDLIHTVEALPENQPGADKTARVMTAKTPLTSSVIGPLDPVDR
jgi:hypothetical protein